MFVCLRASLALMYQTCPSSDHEISVMLISDLNDYRMSGALTSTISGVVDNSPLFYGRMLITSY